MAFKISKVKGHPKFDSLPVAKIIDYPLEKRDYKPYAQARLCVNEQGFILQLWAFETHPEPQSSLKAVFALDPGQDKLLSVEFFPAGEPVLLVDGKSHPAGEMHVHRFEGEDLQGVYWGATLTLPHTLLKEIYPGLALAKGDRILGNLYKLCTGERPHSGSFTPADFAGGRPFEKDSLDWFDLVEY